MTTLCITIAHCLESVLPGCDCPLEGIESQMVRVQHTLPAYSGRAFALCDSSSICFASHYHLSLANLHKLKILPTGASFPASLSVWTGLNATNKKDETLLNPLLKYPKQRGQKWISPAQGRMASTGQRKSNSKSPLLKAGPSATSRGTTLSCPEGELSKSFSSQYSRCTS